MTKVKDIDALLPQTQCGECGFSGCRPYAEALAQNNAPINRCPPGGEDTIKALAAYLKIDAAPYLNSTDLKSRPPVIAAIRENECIGCTKCIQACPVDAIIGSGKVMHAILTTECTGCGLCIDPCPVDCIELLPIEEPTYSRELARQRFEARKIRQLREQQAMQQSYREKKQLALKSRDAMLDKQAKQDYVLQALTRVKEKKSHG